MRMPAGLLAISLGLASGVLAREPTQKPGDQTTRSSEDAPVASWSGVEGPIQGQVVENAGVENRVFFVPFGEGSPSMEEMRARLANPEQRKVMRAEYRTSLEQTYPDVDEVLNLDSRTHDALMELLADQYLRTLDEMFSNTRRDASFSPQGMLEAENRKLDQLREVLGEDGLERYQEYSVTVYERSQVREVDAHLGATDKLSPEQRTRLVKLFKERNQVPPPTPPRMSELLRSHDPRSPTFREDMQRESELAAIEDNEQMLRHKETANRVMAERTSEFLSPAQNAALAKANEADLARLRKWIEQARAKAGLDPADPQRKVEARSPSRKPAAGDVTLDLVVCVNGGEPVHVVHTGQNGEPLKFIISEDLSAEAEWTLFDDDWIDVRLTYFEEGPNGRRRLQGGSNFGTMGRISGESAPGNNSIGARGSSSTIVTGRKAYSVELSASATAQ